jgi:hypothetical protein
MFRAKTFVGSALAARNFVRTLTLEPVTRRSRDRRQFEWAVRKHPKKGRQP